MVHHTFSHIHGSVPYRAGSKFGGVWVGDDIHKQCNGGKNWEGKARSTALADKKSRGKKHGPVNSGTVLGHHLSGC